MGMQLRLGWTSSILAHFFLGGGEKIKCPRAEMKEVNDVGR